MKKTLQEATEAFENRLDSMDSNEDIIPQVTHSTVTNCGQSADAKDVPITWDMYVTYPFMLWDPLAQYKTIFTKDKLSCPLCANDGVLFSHVYRSGEWYNGRLTRLNPRVFFDVHTPTLLVSAKYKCRQGHEIVACHPAVLQLLQKYVEIPFILTHRQGFTLDLINFVEELIDNGQSFVQVEDLIKNQYKGTFDHFETSFWSDLEKSTSVHVSDCQTQISFPKFTSQYFPKPSTSLLIDTFLKRFFQNEHLYQSSMDSIKARCVTCHQTFDNGCNIGYKTEDQKWMNQYNSIFYVLNERGEVVNWKFTRSKVFDEEYVINLCAELKNKFEPSVLGIVCVDDCCKWRDILSEKSPQFLIKQNLLHAVQQFSKKTRKNSPVNEELSQEYEAVFRDPLDTGATRGMATPGQDIILTNLGMFLNKWNDCVRDGVKVLTNAHLNVIEGIRAHIVKGCLSGIPVHHSSRLGEDPHASMKKLLRRKIGVQLAYVKISRYFFKHNQQLGENESMDSLRLREYKTATCPITEPAVLNDVSHTVSSKRDHVETRHPVLESLKNLALTSPVIDEISESINQVVELEIKNLSSVDLSMPDSTDSLQSYGNLRKCTSILQHALAIFKVILLVADIWSTEPTNLQKIPFLFQNAANYFASNIQENENTTNLVDENTRLQNNARSFGLSVVPVAGDGNCFFTSVSFQLLQILDSDCPTERHQFLESLGVTADISADELSLILRDLVVNEWLTNRNEYQSFFASMDIENEAERFRRSGEFAGALGDALPIAMANVLNMPILIFTTVQNMPIISVAPRVRFNRDAIIYLSYTQQGAGHYDALVSQVDGKEEVGPGRQVDSNKVATIANKVARCRCGVNKKKKPAADPKYRNRTYSNSRRCKCVRSNSLCSELCACVGKCGGVECGGGALKRGQRKNGVFTRKSRPRELHDIQQVETCPNSKVFLDSMVPEESNSDNMNMLEYVLVAAIILHLEANVSNSYVSDVKKHYDSILSFVEKYKVLLSVTFKSLSDLAKILSQVLTIKDAMT